MWEKFGSFLRAKAWDLLVGVSPKVYSMVEENNILGLYDTRFLLTKQEQLVGAVQIEGLSLSALAQQDLENYFECKHNALSQLCGIVLRIYTKRQEITLKQNPRVQNPHAQEIIYNFESKSIYENSYYLILETTTTPLKGFFETKKRALIASDAKDPYAHKLSLLNDAIAKITHALQDFHPQILNAHEVLEFYAAIINGIELPLQPHWGFLSDSYIATNVFFHKDYFLQERYGMRVYKRILGIKAYESQSITSIALSSLLHQPKELDIVFSIKPLGLQEALAFIQEKIRLSLSKLVRAQLEHYYELLKSKQLVLQQCALNIILKSPSLDALNQHTQEVLSLLSNQHLVGVVETLGLKPAYFSLFPGRIQLNPRLRLLSAQALACLVVFERANRGFKSNSWGDMPLSVFKNLDHSPYLFNFHNQEVRHKGVAAHSVAKVNGHTMIIGATGAGKTTLMGFLMMSALKYDHLNILALDRAYGLFSCTHYFGGVYNSGAHFQINPLSLERTQENHDFLHSFYAAMLEVGTQDIIERNAIHKALESLYATLYPQAFCLQDFKDALVHNPRLSLALEPYCNHPLFNAMQDSLEFKTPWTTINMDAITLNTKDLGLLAYYIFYKVLSRALKTKQGFLLFVDEFKSYAQNSVLNDHINTLITQGRKANGVVVLALQDVHQLYDLKHAKSFINNMGTLIFYPQKHMDSALLSTQLGIQLSHMEAHFLENTPTHAHQVLIKNMGDGSSNIVDISLKALGPHLQIFSSNATHAQHLEQLMRAHPRDWRAKLLTQGA
ncbi:VirB4 family type IV secretion/conjugal transfer ATPase [Helicobacter labacensis]|uniref:VirB4 family type IV secretion/conjugal transfer ATPase n=1 Tax=Helicobacter labacensis TaxID=2316079 RepID=UPI000EAEDF5F|nr:TraM recognition domain-containing protein [Helicobacter labacensis]